MKMHGRLGLAGGSGGKGNQADIILAGRHRPERIRLTRHRGFQLAGRAAIANDAAERRGIADGLQLARQLGRADRKRDVGLLGDLPKLAGAQHRHGRDGDGAGLHHRQPRREHEGRVRAAQQYAIAGNDTQVLRQHMAKPVGLGRQFRIAPDGAFVENSGFLRGDFGQRVVQQPLAAIERVGNLQLRQGKFKNRPLVLGRQIVPGKIIAVQRGANCHAKEFYA